MTAGGARRQSVGVMGIVAAFGIVWTHMRAPGRTEGYVAQGLFVILTAFLSVGSLERGGWRRFWLGRLARFLWPWLVWSLFFCAIDAVRGSDLGAVLAAAWLTTGVRIWMATGAAIALGAGAMWLHDHADPVDPIGPWLLATIPLLYVILSAVLRLTSGRFLALAADWGLSRRRAMAYGVAP